MTTKDDPMTPEQRSILSEYRQLTSLNAEHGVYLMQHVETGELYVQKTLVNYQADIFAGLKAEPVPNMPRIIEAIEDGGRLIVIESYVSGRTLQKILDQDGPLPVQQVLDIGLQLCAVLKQLHVRGIIHRDIKPSNVILSDEGVVNLLDLDAAKVYKAEEQADTRLIGTQGYAAPEQYGFGASSPVTDIYAAGVLLNVLAAGEFPNAANTPDASLNEVIRRCVRMEPGSRYQSVEELEKALRKIGTGRTRRKVLIPLLFGAFIIALLFALIRPFHKRTAPAGSDTDDSGGIETSGPANVSTDTQAGYTPEMTSSSEDRSEADADSTAAVSPELFVKAVGENTGINHLNPVGGELLTITDTVYCEALEPGREYLVHGVLMNKATGAPVTISGKPLTDEVLFTPSEAGQTAELSFRFDASSVAGTVVVVFESITENGREVFVHKDVDDADKTVYIPKLTSCSVAEDTGEKVTGEGKLTTIIDTVTYNGLEAGREYTLRGWLYDQINGGDLLTGGTKVYPVSAEVTFMPTSSSGSLELRFTFDSTLLAGKIIIAAEKLLTDGKIVANHLVTDEWDQMIFVPKMTPALKEKNPEPDNIETTNVLISDTVSFSALLPGREYCLRGALINKATKEPILIDGEEVTDERYFISTGTEPEVSLVFIFDAAPLAGTEIVVAATLYYNGIVVAAHDKITDADPSVILLTGD